MRASLYHLFLASIFLGAGILSLSLLEYVYDLKSRSPTTECSLTTWGALQRTLVHNSTPTPELFKVLDEDGGVEMVQERRKKLLKSVCEIYFQAPSHEKFGLFVDVTHKYIFCETPKVASTTWKQTLAHANGAPPDITMDKLSQYLKRVRMLLLKDESAVKNHFKFMFVRHPFERLVSAYRDKFANLERQSMVGFYRPYWTISSYIKKWYRKDPTNKVPVTFPEFVHFILDPTTPSPLDPHWRPMHAWCQPCQLQYDFIGHYETLSTDAAYVLDKIGIQSDRFERKLSKEGSVVGNRTSATVDQLFSQLTDEEINRLTYLYYLDFKLFGYSPDLRQFRRTSTLT